MSLITDATFALGLLQAGAAALPPPARERIALPLLPQLTSTACGTSDAGEIVVCGRRDQEHYRLRPLPPLPEHQSVLGKPLDAKIGPIRLHGLTATLAF